jgi:release factor glutamine methyltransferase
LRYESRSVSSSAPAPQVWTIESVLRWATDDFKARGIETPRLDAELLLARALGATRISLIVDAKRPLDPGELAKLRELVTRRRSREPIAYIIGEREFYGRTFRVDRRTLVPRPDTEALVDVALERTRGVSMSMRALGAYNVAFGEGDLFAALGPRAPRCRFDVVTANPPYIPTGDIPSLMLDVRDFEPRLALDGGGDGLALLRRIVTGAPPHLVGGGVLAVEVGAGEAPEVAHLFDAAGFTAVEVRRDYARIERVVSGMLENSAKEAGR